MIIGKSAARTTWPLLENWLKQHLEKTEKPVTSTLR
jgi:hypothetical protein